MGEVLAFPDVRLERIDLDRGLDPVVLAARARCAEAMRRWSETGLVVDLEVAVDAAIDYQQACNPADRPSRSTRCLAGLMAGLTVGSYLVAAAAWLAVLS